MKLPYEMQWIDLRVESPDVIESIVRDCAQHCRDATKNVAHLQLIGEGFAQRILDRYELEYK